MQPEFRKCALLFFRHVAPLLDAGTTHQRLCPGLEVNAIWHVAWPDPVAARHQSLGFVDLCRLSCGRAARQCAARLVIVADSQ